MSTLVDIAKAAGVSHSTVSRVLNGNGQRLRPTCVKRAERIKELADAMGYRTNSFARGVRNGRFGNVGLLLGLDPLRSAVPIPLLQSITTSLQEHQLTLSLAMLPDEAMGQEGLVPQLLREHMADGLLVYYTDHFPAGMIERIQQHKEPTLWMNVKMPHSCIHPDDHDAGRRAAEHLLGLGHRRIAFVDLSHRPSDPSIHYSAHDRYAGYAEAMRDTGLTPRRLWHEQVDQTHRRVEFATGWLRETDRPTAVVTLGSGTDLAVLHAAAMLGLRVPEDLSVVTFGSHVSAILGTPLTTLMHPHDALGREAVAVLLRRIKHPERRPRPLSIPFDLVPASSCGPPPLDPSLQRNY